MEHVNGKWCCNRCAHESALQVQTMIASFVEALYDEKKMGYLDPNPLFQNAVCLQIAREIKALTVDPPDGCALDGTQYETVPVEDGK